MDKITGIAIAKQGAQDRWGNSIAVGKELQAVLKDDRISIGYGMFSVDADDPSWQFVPEGEETPLQALRQKYSYAVDPNWAAKFLPEHSNLENIHACPIDEGQYGYAIEFAQSGETPDDWKFFSLEQKIALWAPRSVDHEYHAVFGWSDR